MRWAVGMFVYQYDGPQSAKNDGDESGGTDIHWRLLNACVLQKQIYFQLQGLFRSTY